MATSNALSILIVDDEPDMLRGLRRILRGKGYEVELAADGEEAVQQVQTHEPDGILMDIRMPGVDGVETFRRIRTISPNAFCIFMTAYSNSQLAEQARKEAGADVLAKPIDPEQICQLIEKTAVTRPVLIVDDDTDFCASLHRTLAAMGFDVLVAYTRADAIAAFEMHPRAVVLLDMKLEEKNGLEVLKDLKTHNPQAIVVLMSGVPEMQPAMQRGLGLTAYKSFTKPFDVDLLVSTIDRATLERGKE